MDNTILSYRMGLDIGAESVGWAIIQSKDNKVIGLGVRIFSAAEQSKTGESLAKPRRIARGARRRIRRRNHRLKRIRRLFVREKLLTTEECSKMFTDLPDSSPPLSPWEIRYKALTQRLQPDELARALYHIAKRRGFKSNRKHKKDSKSEEGQLLAAVNENKKIMEEKGYKTVAEMVLKEPEFKYQKRNRMDSYKHSFGRDLLENEVITILDSQYRLGFQISNNPSFSLERFKKEFLQIMLSQRNFIDGPGSGPYSGNQIEKMRGQCTLENGEKRCAKACFTFEKFRVLQKLASERLRSLGEKPRAFTPDEIGILLKQALSFKTIKYKKIRKLLKIDDRYKFSSISYKETDDEAKAENAAFLEMKAYYEVHKAVKNTLGEPYWKKKTQSPNFDNWMDCIGEIVTVFKTDDNIKSQLKKEGFSDEEIEALRTISFAGFGHLSLKALKKINPFLEKGSVYSDACQAAGYDFKATGNNKIEKFVPVIPKEEVVNPVVIRALSQSRKVINTLIRKYGSPSSIHIEMARDIGKSPKQKKEVEKNIERNRDLNETAKKEILEITNGGIDAKRGDVLKYRFYKEQQCKCIYSLKEIAINRLFEPGYVEIDHILPYSRTFNNAQSNKVLVLSSENRDKKIKRHMNGSGRMNQGGLSLRNMSGPQNLYHIVKGLTC